VGESDDILKELFRQLRYNTSVVYEEDYVTRRARGVALSAARQIIQVMDIRKYNLRVARRLQERDERTEERKEEIQKCVRQIKDYCYEHSDNSNTESKDAPAYSTLILRCLRILTDIADVPQILTADTLDTISIQIEE